MSDNTFTIHFRGSKDREYQKVFDMIQNSVDVINANLFGLSSKDTPVDRLALNYLTSKGQHVDFDIALYKSFITYLSQGFTNIMQNPDLRTVYQMYGSNKNLYKANFELENGVVLFTVEKGRGLPYNNPKVNKQKLAEALFGFVINAGNLYTLVLKLGEAKKLSIFSKIAELERIAAIPNLTQIIDDSGDLAFACERSRLESLYLNIDNPANLVEKLREAGSAVEFFQKVTELFTIFISAVTILKAYNVAFQSPQVDEISKIKISNFFTCVNHRLDDYKNLKGKAFDYASWKNIVDVLHNFVILFQEFYALKNDTLTEISNAYGTLSQNGKKTVGNLEIFVSSLGQLQESLKPPATPEGDYDDQCLEMERNIERVSNFIKRLNEALETEKLLLASKKKRQEQEELLNKRISKLVSENRAVQADASAQVASAVIADVNAAISGVSASEGAADDVKPPMLTTESSVDSSALDEDSFVDASEFVEESVEGKEAAPGPLEAAPAPLEAAPGPLEAAPGPLEAAPAPLEAAAAAAAVEIEEKVNADVLPEALVKRTRSKKVSEEKKPGFLETKNSKDITSTPSSYWITEPFPENKTLHVYEKHSETVDKKLITSYRCTPVRIDLITQAPNYYTTMFDTEDECTKFSEKIQENSQVVNGITFFNKLFPQDRWFSIYRSLDDKFSEMLRMSLVIKSSEISSILEEGSFVKALVVLHYYITNNINMLQDGTIANVLAEYTNKSPRNFNILSITTNNNALKNISVTSYVFERNETPKPPFCFIQHIEGTKTKFYPWLLVSSRIKFKENRGKK